MPRTHWLILAIGIALMLFVSLSPDQRRPMTESLLPDPESEVAEAELREPDLLLERAVITQFRPDGSLHYRLHAERIAHFPASDETALTQPRLLLQHRAAPPWELTAARGQILGGAGLLLPPDAEPELTHAGAEQVILEEDVHIWRRHPDDRFLHLTTSLLALHPEREYAETDRPVIIETEAGRTTAASLEADLTAGRMILAAIGENRVHTTVVPERLP